MRAYTSNMALSDMPFGRRIQCERLIGNHKTQVKRLQAFTQTDAQAAERMKGYIAETERLMTVYGLRFPPCMDVTQ